MTCCPFGARRAVQRAPGPSRHSGRRRFRRLHGPRRCDRSARVPHGRGPERLRDPRRGAGRPPPDAAQPCRRCCGPKSLIRRGSRAPTAWLRCRRGLAGPRVAPPRSRAWVGPDEPGWDPTSVAVDAAGRARRCRRFGPAPRMPFYPITPQLRIRNQFAANRITPHAIVGGDPNVCSAVSYFSTRVG